MDDIFVPCLVPPSLATEEGSGLSPSSVLLDNTAYISAVAVSNATTAVAETSAGTPIHVSFCLAPHPPRLSYMCVHFPGPAAPLSAAIPDGAPAARCVMQAPRVISTHAGLVLLRVPQPGAMDITNPRYLDYFVYTASPGPGTASLHRLRQPLDAAADFATFRCSGGTYRYIIAGLGNTTDREKFRLQLYDSDTGRWTSTLLSVDAPQRDTVLPIPSTATELGFHYTSKVITLGGPRATIGWVDLWRGILLCDVLDDKPVLRDVPLPKPSKGNRPYFCRGGPHRYREIDVVTLPGPGQQHIEIKYIEMETRPGEDLLPPRRSVVDTSDSDDDDDESDKDLVVAPYWKATIWTMPVPVGSWKDWRKDRDSRVDVTDIAVDDPRHCEVLLRLPRLRTDQESAAMSLRRLITAYPTLELGVDGDLVIYLLSKVDFMDREGWVIAVGARDKKLRGIAELDSRKNDFFRRYYLHTDISKFPTEATDKLTVLSWTITIGHIQISDQGYRCVRSPRGKEKVVVNDEAK